MFPRARLLIFLGGIIIGGFWKKGALPGASPSHQASSQSFSTVLQKIGKTGVGQRHPGPSGPDLPADQLDAADPAERAVARGVLLDSQMTAIEGRPGRWQRDRLVQTSIQPRLVRVVEEWGRSPSSRAWICHDRKIQLADQLILKTRKNVSHAVMQKRIEALGWTVHANITDSLYTIRLPSATLKAVPEALALLKQHGDIVANSEADGVGFPSAMPNDPLFPSQWANSNNGTVADSIPGLDVGALGFWDILESAPGVTIAILDSGLDFEHRDLVAIEWRNPRENPSDQLDNDGNGLVDDVKGWDFVRSDNDPSDKIGHGTEVTGIIAANRNNRIGITGMLAGVKIMTCKVTEDAGTISDLIAATAYARKNGASIINMSLQNQGYSEGLSEEFTRCEEAGILLCISAGNGQGFSNDERPNYPSSYTHDCILAVGNHREDGGRSTSSNVGYESVDLFAPGTNVWTTTTPPINAPSSSILSYYKQTSGTSLSTPYVTAVAAAIKSLNPSWRAAEIKNCILSSVIHSPSYFTFCQTGGRLNAMGAIALAIRTGPSADTDQDSFSNLFEYLTGTHVDNGGSKPLIWRSTTAGHLRIGVMPVLSRPDASLIIESSNDLQSWNRIPSFGFSSSMQGEIPFSGESGRFLRIRVSVDGSSLP